MNILFLDIDGVLNSHEYYSSLPEEDMLLKPIDETCVTRLKHIVDETGALLVLSSSWRGGWDRNPDLNYEEGQILDEVFARHGLSIYDKTPLSPLRKRALEIKEWLSAHQGQVSRFVILDDCDFSWRKYRLHRHWVATDYLKSGLTEEKAEEAISLFGVNPLYFLPEKIGL